MRSVLISTSLSSLICSWLASRCSQWSPSQQRFPRALQLKEQILKEQITDDRVFFKMPFRPCPSGCGHFQSADDGHDSRQYSSRLRRSSTSCPGVMHHPPLLPGPGLSLPVAVGALLPHPELLHPRLNRHLGRRVEPLFENCAAPSPGGGPGGESSVSFCLNCSVNGPRASGTHFLKERAISFSSGFSGPWDDSVRRPASSLSPTTHFASSQESTVRGRYFSPRTSGQSRLGPREFGEDASERTAFCTIHPYSLSLHHHRYVDCAVGVSCTASGGVAHAAQPVSLAHTNNSTRLRDSVRQATSQVQRRSRDVGGSPERPCLARGDCCPPGKGCNRAGPSSRDEAGVLQTLLYRTQERWWPSTNPGSASLEPGFTQAPVQDADA